MTEKYFKEFDEQFVSNTGAYPEWNDFFANQSISDFEEISEIKAFIANVLERQAKELTVQCEKAVRENVERNVKKALERQRKEMIETLNNELRSYEMSREFGDPEASLNREALDAVLSKLKRGS